MSHMYTFVPLLNTLTLGQKYEMLEISNARIEWKLNIDLPVVNYTTVTLLL